MYIYVERTITEQDLRESFDSPEVEKKECR